MSQGANATITNPDFQKLGDVVLEAMERYGVPGVAVGVWYRGEEQTAGFGVTNVNHPLPVNADTLFQIGSITKTFTATAAMRLVEMGRLSLDVPVRTYLPDLRLRDENAAANVTMRQLFTHMGGWEGDYFDDLGSGDDALAKYVAKMAELPQLTPLGEVWAYNNAGFSLAGRVIEVVTSKTYEAAMKDLIFDPLSLKMTFILPADVMLHRFAVGHLEVDGKPVVASPWPLARTANPAGAIVSTVRDLLTYARFHIGGGLAADGKRLLKQETVAFMQSRLTNGALDEYRGVAWALNDVGKVKIVQHGGATRGQMAVFIMAPEREFAIAVLTNSSRGAELYRDVTRWGLRHYLDASSPEPVPLKLTEGDLSAYTGRYVSASADTELVLRDGELVMQMIPKGGFPTKDTPPGPTPPPSRLAFCGSDRVIALDGMSKDLQGEFLRDPDGRIVWFRFGGRIRKRQA